MEAFTLLKDLVSIDSTNPGKGEGEVADYLIRILREPFERIGGFYERIDCDGNRPILRFVLPGEDREKCFSFICHMDTVPIGLNWSKNPFGELEGNRFYGRGSSDMKAGLASASAAFLSFLSDFASDLAEGEKKKLGPSLQIIFSYDEEGDMKGVEEAIKRKWITKDTLLMDTEPTDGSIQTAHKGRFWYHVFFHGRAAHASEPEMGTDAILCMGMTLQYAKEAVEKLKVDSFLGDSKICFGQCKGGIHPYQVPAEAECSVDMRLVPPYTVEDGREILLQAGEKVKEKYPGLRLDVEINGNRPAIPHYLDNALLPLLKNAIEKSGYKAEVLPFPGYTDTAVAAGILGNKNTLSYGPGSLKVAHQRDEFLELEDLERCTKIYRKLLDSFVLS